MQTVEVEYECCGAKLSREVPLEADQTLLHASALADYLLGDMDAEHDSRHPECSPIPYMLTSKATLMLEADRLPADMASIDYLALSR